jgi:hypothetical protein
MIRSPHDCIHPGSGCSRPGYCVPRSNWLILYFTYSSPARSVLPSLADFAAAEAAKLRPGPAQPAARPGPALHDTILTNLSVNPIVRVGTDQNRWE